MSNSITINVLADTRKFSRGLQGVQSQLGGLEDIGGRLGNKLGGMLRTGATAIGALGAAFLGNALVKGGQRLIGIDNAQAKLRGLGHDAATVDGIMENALGAVKGTAFGLDEAATTAAGAVAAGIEPGKELERYLTLTADAATIAGVSMGEMGSVMNKVQANGRAMTENLNQLQDRGIPVLGWLADEYGVTTEEMSKMVSQGKVDADTFTRVLEQNLGGAAQESGNTFSGALANMQAAMGRFGAALLGPFLGDATKGFGSVIDVVDNWTAAVQPHVERFAEWFRTEGIPALQDFATAAGEWLLPKLQALGRFLIDTVVPAVQSFASFLADNAFWVGQLASIIGGLVAGLIAYNKVMQAIRTVQAVVNALMAANPIGLVAIALAGLVAGLIYAYNHSETFRRIVDNAFRVVANAARTLVDWVKGIPRWFSEMRVKVSAYVGAARTAVTTAFNRMWSIISGFGRNIINAARNAWNSFTGAIRTGVQHALEWVKWFPSQAVYQIARLGSQLWNAGWDVIMGLVRGITAAVGRAVEAVKKVGRSIMNGIRSVLGIRSPSKEFEKLGVLTVKGLERGLQRVAGIRRAASGLAREVANGFAAPELALNTAGSIKRSRSQGNTYNIKVDVPVGASPVETGRQLVRAIEAYERVNGRAL